MCKRPDHGYECICSMNGRMLVWLTKMAKWFSCKFSSAALQVDVFYHSFDISSTNGKKLMSLYLIVIRLKCGRPLIGGYNQVTHLAC